MLANKIKREQRVTQMVENAHEQHQVEAFAQSRNIVDGHLPKLDIGVVDLRHQLRLRQIAGIAVDGHDPGCAPAFHLQRVEASIAANVEHALALQIRRQDIGKGAELVRSEEHTSELQSLMRISYAVVCSKKKNN